MKKAIGLFIAAVIIGGVSVWVFVNRHSLFTSTDLAVDESFVTRTLFDPNPTHPFAMVTMFDSGATAAVETTLVNGKEVVKAVHIESRDGTQGVVDVRSNGLPWMLSVEGYTIAFESWRDTFVDLTITTPDGIVTSHANVEFPVPNEYPRVSWLGATPVSAGSGYYGMDIPDLPRTGTEDMDRQYYFDTLSLTWNTVACSLGLLTSYIPDPVSAWAASLGCLSLVARITPAPVDLGVCKADTALFDCVKGVVATLLGTDTVTLPFLFGLLTLASHPDRTLQGVKMDIRHQSGRELRMETDYLSRFGYDEIGIALGNGAYTITIHGEEFDLQDRGFRMAVSDLEVKIVDSETEGVVYEHILGEERMLPFTVTMRLPAEERDWEASFKETKSKGSLEGTISVHQDTEGRFTCEWSARGTIDWTSEAGPIAGPFSMVSEDCHGTMAEDDEEKLAYDVRLRGMQKGRNPVMPDVFADSNVPMGEYEDRDFIVEFRIKDDSLLGFIAADGDILSFGDVLDWSITGDKHHELSNYSSDAALLFNAGRKW